MVGVENPCFRPLYINMNNKTHFNNDIIYNSVYLCVHYIYVYLCVHGPSVVCQGKLPSFLDLAGQTLQSFVQSVEEDSTPGPLDQTSTEHQFVLALAGVITSESSIMTLTLGYSPVSPV